MGKKETEIKLTGCRPSLVKSRTRQNKKKGVMERGSLIYYSFQSDDTECQHPVILFE